MINKILEFIFSKYTQDIKRKAYESADLRFEVYKSTLDIKDLIRNRCKGITLNRPDELSLVENHLSSLDENSRLAFLSKAYDIIKNNETFKLVVDSLLVDSQHKASLYSSDMAEVNFNRATANGIMLLEEELGRLSSMYLSEKINQPITEEEKHEIIS